MTDTPYDLTVLERPWLIGITGFARAGKDSIAAALAKYGYERRALADPLKQMALDIDPTVWMPAGWTCPVMVNPVPEGGDAANLSVLVATLGWENAKTIPDVRRFLQRLGTEGVRKHMGEDFWVRTLLLGLDGTKRYVVPDVRFLNEAEAIRAHGGVVWRVVRPGLKAGGHASEEEQTRIEADLTVMNFGSLEDLAEQVSFAFQVPAPAQPPTWL
jgi:hypothetical protein